MMTTEQIQIVRSMVNPYDYDRFIELCNSKGVTVMSNRTYLTEIKSLMGGIKTFPGLSPKDAYDRYTKTTPTTKSCCGGSRSSVK